MTKRIIVYHNTEFLATRARRIQPGETIAWRGIDQWSDEENKKFDEVINLSDDKKKTPKLEKESKS